MTMSCQEGRISDSDFNLDLLIGTLEKRDTILKFYNNVFGKHVVWDCLFNIYFFFWKGWGGGGVG